MSEPTTEAGRAMLGGLKHYAMPLGGEYVPLDQDSGAKYIVAIEQEAAANALVNLADRVERGAWDSTFAPIVERSIRDAIRAERERIAAGVRDLPHRLYGITADVLDRAAVLALITPEDHDAPD